MAPEKIENVYTRSGLLAQAFVYGDSLRSQLVAVAVPDPETAAPWAKSRDLPTDMPALCREKLFQEAVLKSMQEEGRAAKLQGFEQVCACTPPPPSPPPPPFILPGPFADQVHVPLACKTAGVCPW